MNLVKQVKFDDDVLNVLRGMEWSPDGLSAKIWQVLDRPLYTKVDKALKIVGGKWTGGKVKAHIFPFDPRPQIEGLLSSGSIEVVRDGFFETPLAVVLVMIKHANILPNMSVLEPSAGMGAIALQLVPLNVSLYVIEKNEQRFEYLHTLGLTRIGRDFLEYYPAEGFGFDRVIMNPPFEEGQDVDHVRHAYDVLLPSGRLVSVMGEHAFFAKDVKSVMFRKWLNLVNARDFVLPAGSFKESGTGVNTRLVIVDKK